MNNYFLKQVNHDELIKIFHLYFGGALYDNTQVIRFKKNKGGDNNEISVNVYYSKNYNIKKIDDSALPSLNKKEIKIKIRETLIDNQVLKIARYICFTNQKLEGAFKYKKLFQVLPLTQDFASNNRNHSITTTYWPIILEVEYCASKDFSINMMRMQEKLNSSLRIINAITRYQFKKKKKCKDSIWGYTWDEHGLSKTKVFQPGYLQEDFLAQADYYSDLSKYQGVKYDKVEEYYKWTYQDDGLIKLPQDFEMIIDKIFTLKDKHRKQFDIATTYFQKGVRVLSESPSVAFICFVIAIESFIEKKEEVCSICKQGKYSVNQKFRQFLTDYLPSIDLYPEFKKMIYDTRSNLAHGSMAFQVDIRLGQFSGLKESHESSLQMNTYFIMRSLFYNWLNKQLQR